MSVKSVLMIFMSLMLVGCSYVSSTAGIQSRNKDLMAARSIPPLKIPPGISSSSFHTYYPVPEYGAPDSIKDVSLQPPGL